MLYASFFPWNVIQWKKQDIDMKLTANRNKFPELWKHQTQVRIPQAIFLEAYSVMVVYYAQMLSIFSDLSPEVYQSVCVSRSPKVDRKENKIQIEDISKVFWLSMFRLLSARLTHTLNFFNDVENIWTVVYSKVPSWWWWFKRLTNFPHT